MKIGILSDTHGVLKDTFLDELQSCDYLLHAGDIGSLKCYETLKDLHVPLYIIKGNCDNEISAGDSGSTHWWEDFLSHP